MIEAISILVGKIKYLRVLGHVSFIIDLDALNKVSNDFFFEFLSIKFLEV